MKFLLHSQVKWLSPDFTRNSMENFETGLYGKHLWNAWDWYSFLKTIGVEERILALPPSAGWPWAHFLTSLSFISLFFAKKVGVQSIKRLERTSRYSSDTSRAWKSSLPSLQQDKRWANQKWMAFLTSVREMRSQGKLPTWELDGRVNTENHNWDQLAGSRSC